MNEFFSENMIETLRKLSELSDLGFDISEPNEIVADYQALADEFYKTQNEMAALRPGVGYEERRVVLRDKLNDLAVSIQGVLDDFEAAAIEALKNAYKNFIPVEFDKCEAGGQLLDVSALVKLRDAWAILSKRYENYERMRALASAAQWLWNEHLRTEPDVSQAGYSTVLPWRKASATPYATPGTLAQDFIERFIKMASAVGVPTGKDDDILGWFGRKYF